MSDEQEEEYDKGADAFYVREGPHGREEGSWRNLWEFSLSSMKGTRLTDEELEDFNLIEEAGSPDWDVFDREGRFLGVVTMPPRFRPSLFLDDTIYGVWRDELDVQYVVRLRIVGDLNLGTT